MATARELAITMARTSDPDATLSEIEESVDRAIKAAPHAYSVMQRFCGEDPFWFAREED